jgi:hypothetical protein
MNILSGTAGMLQKKLHGLRKFDKMQTYFKLIPGIFTKSSPIRGDEGYNDTQKMRNVQEGAQCLKQY